MRLLTSFLLAIGLLTCFGCGGRGTVDGGGTDRGSYGRAGISLPF
jgi:hypothetical protein